MTEKDIKNAVEILRLSRDMENAGFPACHNDYGYPMHCKSCVELYNQTVKQNQKCMEKTGRGR